MVCQSESPKSDVTEVVKSGTTTSGAMTVTAQSFDTSSSTATRVGGSVTLTLQQNAFAFISYSANIVQDTGSSTSLALQKSTNGGTSFTTITDFQSNTAGFHQPFTHVEQHTGSTGSVEYRIVVKTTSNSDNLNRTWESKYKCSRNNEPQPNGPIFMLSWPCNDYVSSLCGTLCVHLSMTAPIFIKSKIQTGCPNRYSSNSIGNK